MANPDGTTVPPPRPGPSGLVIAAFVLALCGLIPILGVGTGIAGLIMGTVALARKLPGKKMAIVAIICGLVLPILPTTGMVMIFYRVRTVSMTVHGRARTLMTQSQIQAAKAALEMFDLDMGRYPTDAEGLSVLRTRPTEPNAARSWNGPYLSVPVTDAWGNALHYEVLDADSQADQAAPYRLWSSGPNRLDEDGMGDDITDESRMSYGSGRL